MVILPALVSLHGRTGTLSFSAAKALQRHLTDSNRAKDCAAAMFVISVACLTHVSASWQASLKLLLVAFDLQAHAAFQGMAGKIGWFACVCRGVYMIISFEAHQNDCLHAVFGYR